MSNSIEKHSLADESKKQTVGIEKSWKTIWFLLEKPLLLFLDINDTLTLLNNLMIESSTC